MSNAMNPVEYTKTDAEFYPTPEKLVDEMLKGIDWNYVQDVLEPSAGKGDIAKEIARWIKIKRIYGYNSDALQRAKNCIDCIEIDPNLRSILKDNGYRVVHDDFLTFRTSKKYDLVVMNPPFSNGDMHFMKALELMRRGGQIVCLLNAETIRNPYTNLRKTLLQTLKQYDAQFEYIADGFKSAERKADVDVVIVKVSIPVEKTDSFIFENLKQKSYEEVDYECTNIVAGDFVAQVVKQYEMEIDAGCALIKEYLAMKPKILEDIDPDSYSSPILVMEVHGNSGDGIDKTLSINNYVKSVRRKYWSALFKNKKFVGRLTSELCQQLNNKVSTLVDYDFSVFNIRQIQAEIFNQVGTGIEDAVLKLFNELTAQYAWFPECSNNIHYYNGWATNKAHRINQKVILPIQAFATWCDHTKLDSYRVFETLSDLEKSLSYLDTGIVDEDYNLWEIIKDCEKNGITKDIPLKYFTVTFYKKGTCHIKFTNLDLLNKLNIVGSQKKNWLPPSYGKKAYKDMTREEKVVVDSFQGEAEYNKVLQRADYYLDLQQPTRLMLTVS